MGVLPAKVENYGIVSFELSELVFQDLDFNDLDFKPQPSYNWQSVGKERLDFNSYQYNVSKVSQDSGLTHFIGGNSNIFANGLISPKVYSSGNSSDVIMDSNPMFQPVSDDSRESIFHSNSYEKVPINAVVKIIKDKRLSDIVCNFYTKAGKKGLTIVPIVQIPEGIASAYLGENSYKDFIAHIDKYVPFGSDPTSLWINLTEKLIKSATEFSVFAEEEISKDDIKYIKNSKIEKLTTAFFGSDLSSSDFKSHKNVVESNYYLFQLLKSIPGSNDEMISILDPIAKLLEKSFDRFSVLDTDRHPSNAFLVKDKEGNQELTHIDFKNISYVSRPTQAIQIFDAFLPVYAPLNALPLETSIFDHEIKLQVIASYLKSVNKITGENTVSDQYKKDFLNYLPVCRFAFNLDLANKSLKKLSTSSNYNDITVNIIAAKHYIHNIYESIAMMKYQNENIDRFDFLKDTPLIDTDGLTKIVDEKFQKLYLEMIPEEVVDATNYWMTH